MTRATNARGPLATLAAAALLLTAVVAEGMATEGSAAADADHPVVGRWVIEAEPGGAVWAFQPSGVLILTGPGDIVSEGTWVPGASEGAFDATVEVSVSGQSLEALGQVSPDATGLAVYVTASEATRPDDWTPWPAVSRLTGTRFGMLAEETPEPTEPPADCLRPQWIGDVIDWDRCDQALTPA
jgi:hypothetical protein